MFQLYVLRDREKVERLIRRAERMGAAALAVTVDAPTLGRRERDVRNRFKLREGLKLANVMEDSSSDNRGGTQATAAAGGASSGAAGANLTTGASKEQSSIAKRIGGGGSAR